jgi:hypothetical protein
VVLGARHIALRSTRGKRTGDDNPLRRGHARRRLALMAREELKLIHQRRPENGLLRVSDLFFAVGEVGAGAGQRGSADAAISLGQIFIRGPD